MLAMCSVGDLGLYYSPGCCKEHKHHQGSDVDHCVKAQGNTEKQVSSRAQPQLLD